MDQWNQQQIARTAENYYEEALKLLETLTLIPSCFGQEQERAKFIQAWINELGVDAWIDEADNVICKLEGENPNEIIAFAAHTDTVFETSIPRTIRREGSRWYCPGIGDDTANLVNMLMGLKYLVTSGVKPKYTLLFAADSGEEGLGNCKGIRKIFETYGSQIKEFYTFDLYLGQVVSGAVGSHRYRISVDAKGGHSYLAFGTPNPILLLSELIAAVGRIELPMEDKTTFNFGMIFGGTSVNTIPEHAEVLYEFRSESQENLKEMETKFYQTLEPEKKRKVFADGLASLTVEAVGIRPGSAFNSTSKAGGLSNRLFLDQMTEQNIAVMKYWYDGKIRTDACSTDANIPLSMKIPANMIGTVTGGGAHTQEEWIEPESMKTGMCVVLDILSRYM